MPRDHERCERCVLTLHMSETKWHPAHDWNVHLGEAIIGGEAHHITIHHPERLVGHEEWFNVAGHRLGHRQSVTLNQER